MFEDVRQPLVGQADRQPLVVVQDAHGSLAKK